MRRVAVYACVLTGALGALWLPTAAQGPAARPDIQQVDGRDAAAREALVKFRRAPRTTDVGAIADDVDADALTPIGRTGVYRVRSRGLSAAALVARLGARADVAYAEPNYIVTISAAPNDPEFPKLWGLENLGQPVGGVSGVPGADIHATAAWDVTVGSANTVVGVIDTGIDYTHADLAPNMWTAPAPFTVDLGGGLVHCAAGTHGFNAILRTCNPMDDHNHGTHVAGTIGAAGNNQRGVVGVNWTTRIMGIKFLNAQGGGSIADAINGIRFAIEAKQAFAASDGADVRVLSNSWGGAGFSQALLDEIDAARQADMLFVAAAGNSGLDNDILPTYPASFAAENIISVAATTNTDQRAWFSNYGDASVHLGAPGVDILSTTIGNMYGSSSGTSMATPHVSGAAALLLSVCTLDTAGLKEALVGTVDAVASLAGSTMTGGRLNAHSAVHSCLAPPPTPRDLAAVAGDGKVLLSWSASLGATRYLVKRSTTQGGPYDTVASNVKGSAYVDAAVANGTTYYYVVAAANPLGESGDSNEASATPNPPSDLVISALTSPSTGGAGASIAVSVTTKNQGAGSAEPTTTAFYLSTDWTLGASDLRLAADQAIGPLAPAASITSSITIMIPADVTTGMYRLFAVADADGSEDESSESNNTSVRLLQIGPDLAISALDVPATGAAGGALTVASTVHNRGAGDAPASSVTFHLSTNATLDAADVPLPGARAVPDLAAGSTHAGSATVTIPADTTVATYYLIAKADGAEEVVETLESNNTLARIIRIGGDLAVSSLTAPATAGAGTTIVVSDTTTNQGSGGVAASVTRFYLSANWTLDPNDVRLDGSRMVPQLGPSAASSGSTTLTIPAATASGTYYLLASADADMTVPETQESNNTASRSVQIGTDLVVAALSVPAKGAAGSALLVSETTKNQGAGTAAASVTKFYLSPNGLLDSNDTLLSPDHGVPELAPGATHTASISLMIPASTAVGSYYLFAKADGGHAVPETQEGNNTAARLLQIGGDLAMTALTAPAKGGAGMSIQISDTTVNQGAGPVAESITQVYLSTNTVVDASDVPLGARAVPGLDAGTSSSGSTLVSIPAATEAGVYYIIAKADAGLAVPETQEGNNARYVSIRIGPDLRVSSLWLSPTKVAAGGTVNVTDTVVNSGAAPAGSSTTSYHLSTNFAVDASDLLLGARAVPALAAGQSSAAVTAVAIPAGTPAGSYYLLANADATDAVDESPETNNVTAVTIQVTTAP